MKCFFFGLFLISVCINSNSQTNDSLIHAKYLDGNLHKILQDNTSYPIEGLKNNIDGDVIVSFILTKEGKVDSITVFKTPSFVLSNNSILSLNALPENWSPARINSTAIDKKYDRMYFNTKPIDYKSKAINFYNKGKYNNALKAFDSAIEDNPYDYVLYTFRADVREKLGDIEGSKNDKVSSNNIKNNILAIIQLDAIGLRRTESLRQVTTINISHH